MNQNVNAQRSMPVSWSVDKEFSDESTGVTVYVKRSSHAKFPRYRIGMGLLLKLKPTDADRTAVREYQPFPTAKLGKVEMPRLAEIVARLWGEAEDYVLGMCQYAEDMRIEESIERSKSNHKPPPPGLKKLGKIDAKKRGA